MNDEELKNQAVTQTSEQETHAEPEGDTTETASSASQPESEVPQPQPEKIKPGALLAAKRAEAGLSEEQIMSRLKMTVRQLRELEADNFDKIHGIAITRGFVRAYAKVLQIDPEPLIAMYPDENKVTRQPPVTRQPTQVTPPPSTSPRAIPAGKRQNKSKMIAYLLFVIILIGGLFAARQYGLLELNFKKKSNGELTKVAAVEVSQTETPAAQAPQNPDANAAQDNAPPTAEGAAATAQPADANATPAVDAAQPAAVTTENTLTLNFSGQTWVQILRADSTVLFEYKGQAGDVQKLEIKEPVTFVVGDPALIQVEFRGAPLSLNRTEPESAARVNLN